MGKGKAYKGAIIGEAGVGKTKLLARLNELLTGEFKYNESVDGRGTIGVNFVDLEIGDKSLVFFDTAGQERFRFMWNMWIKGSDIILIQYDVSDSSSAEKLEEFYYTAREICSDIPIILIGNKIDLERKVSQEFGENLAKKLNVEYVETSAGAPLSNDTHSEPKGIEKVMELIKKYILK